MNLTGKTAIVTGGTKGIGRAIAESLVNAGVNVSISARHESEIERAVAELNKAGGASVTSRAAGFCIEPFPKTSATWTKHFLPSMRPADRSFISAFRCY